MAPARRDRIWIRANGCCEYCQMPQESDVRLRELADAAGLTTAEFARKAGVTEDATRKYFRGTAPRPLIARRPGPQHDRRGGRQCR
jgi:hypothetical protein